MNTHAASMRNDDAVQADLQQAFDAISDPVSMVDANYRLIRANAAYQAHFGGHAVANGHHQCFAQSGQTAPCEGCPLPHTLATGRPGFVQRERWVPREPDGQLERRVYQTWTYPARNRLGVVDHAVEIIKDVTDQERLHEAMNRAEALRLADRMKAELLGTVSHELRSPLAAIRGYAETLQRHERRIAREERQEFLTAIIQASDRLQVVIDRVLELSELAMGTMPVQRVPLDVSPIIREAVDACARQAARTTSRQFTFTIAPFDATEEAAPDIPSVMADPRLLRDVLDHVLENAVRFSPDGGSITVEVRLQPARRDRMPDTWEDGHAPRGQRDETPAEEALAVPSLEIVVRDSGVGIPAEQLGHIFDRFHRVDTRLTREVDGLGLGLAICQQIVALHEGAIWAESEPGKGSTFHVLLPLAPDSAPHDPLISEQQTEGL